MHKHKPLGLVPAEKLGAIRQGHCCCGGLTNGWLKGMVFTDPDTFLVTDGLSTRWDPPLRQTQRVKFLSNMIFLIFPSWKRST